MDNLCRPCDMPTISQGGSLFSFYLLSSCCESICTARVGPHASVQTSAPPGVCLPYPVFPACSSWARPGCSSVPSLLSHTSRLGTVSCRPPCCLPASACLASVWPTDCHSHHHCFTCAFRNHAFYNRIKIQISAERSHKTTFWFKGKSVSRLGR